MSSRIQKLRQEVHKRRRLRQRKPVTVALDAMGTDIGPEELIRGAREAVVDNPLVTVVCTGPHGKLDSLMKQHELEHPRLQIEDATDVVDMHASPKDSLKKKHSSVAVAARLVHDGRAEALVSAGNTGATMATAMFQWRTLPGISRPAIVAYIPHPERPSILLDVGANVDCKPRHLLHFGLMGAVYARYILHRPNPRVALLSIGEEDSKGNELVFEAQQLLRRSTLNFAGHAEGRDIINGVFDVIVCDGFVGNVVLKFGEGLVEFLFKNIKEEVGRNPVSKLGALTMIPAFRSLKKRVDYAEYGGAPLLGLHGVCVICHGSSRSKAIKNAIRVASEMVGAKINQHIIDLAARNSASNI